MSLWGNSMALQTTMECCVYIESTLQNELGLATKSIREDEEERLLEQRTVAVRATYQKISKGERKQRP